MFILICKHRHETRFTYGFLSILRKVYYLNNYYLLLKRNMYTIWNYFAYLKWKSSLPLTSCVWVLEMVCNGNSQCVAKTRRRNNRDSQRHFSNGHQYGGLGLCTLTYCTAEKLYADFCIVRFAGFEVSFWSQKMHLGGHTSSNAVFMIDKVTNEA